MKNSEKNMNAEKNAFVSIVMKTSCKISQDNNDILVAKVIL
jgi:hypothetical protein